MSNLLKEARLKKHYTLEYLGNLCGFTKQNMHNFENYKRIPNYKTTILLSNLLEIDLKTLVYHLAQKEK